MTCDGTEPEGARKSTRSTTSRMWTKSSWGVPGAARRRRLRPPRPERRGRGTPSLHPSKWSEHCEGPSHRGQSTTRGDCLVDAGGQSTTRNDGARGSSASTNFPSLQPLKVVRALREEAAQDHVFLGQSTTWNDGARDQELQHVDWSSTTAAKVRTATPFRSSTS
jgi:hypothetical protein